MNAKRLLLVFLAFFSFVAAQAQDKIYKKNGEVINAKVSIINGDVIIFKRFDNPDGPEYSIPKGDVARIYYSNGTEDVFEENNDRIGVPRKDVPTGRDIAAIQNIIAFAPIEITESGPGAGISYERFLDKSGWVSLYVPAIVSLRSTEQTYNSNVAVDAMFYVQPGIKLYTNMNSSKKTKFAIGPSFVLGAGTGRTSDIGYYPPASDPNEKRSRFLLGAMANIGGNIFPTQHVYVGFDFSLGFSYINTYGNIDRGVRTLIQMGVRVGYRYARKK